MLFATDGSAQRLQNYHGFQQTYPGAIAIGVQTGPNFNFAASGPYADCDCTFDGGSGIGYHAGLHLDILVNHWFGIRLQGLYEDHSTVYVKDFAGSTFGDDGAPAAVNIQRRAEVGIRYLSTSFMLTWVTGPQGLYLLSGASFGFFLDGTLKDEEYITTPGYVYPGTSTSRTVFADEGLDAAQDLPMRGGIVIGVGYDLPLARGISLGPELQFDYPLTAVVDGNADWNIPSLRASVALRFGL
ncbi:MAG: outer membrane beta-barrel protein [Bacteroidetes bacterium]|nr:outer membrane beta-barrel protein [Bacteroidota bacterium]